MARIASGVVAAGLSAEVAVDGDVRGAIAGAREWAGRHGVVCVCGSLYLVGDALAALGLDPYGAIASDTPLSSSSSQR